jgi:hypothetical protein
MNALTGQVDCWALRALLLSEEFFAGNFEVPQFAVELLERAAGAETSWISSMSAGAPGGAVSTARSPAFREFLGFGKELAADSGELAAGREQLGRCGGARAARIFTGFTGRYMTHRGWRRGRLGPLALVQKNANVRFTRAGSRAIFSSRNRRP